MSSSEQSGTPIGLEDAMRLLHKLVTESIKVRAFLWVTEAHVNTSLIGSVRVGKDGVFGVFSSNEAEGPQVLFMPSLAEAIRYGDGRVLDGNPSAAAFFKGQDFVSCLSFRFPGTTVLALFEIDTA